MVFEELFSVYLLWFVFLLSVLMVVVWMDDRYVVVFFDGCCYWCEFDVDGGMVGELVCVLCVGGLGFGVDMITGVW